MADRGTECSMCGDIGFADKLFQCIRCRSRFQHSYCSGYHEESMEAAGVCDWCLSAEQRQDGPGKKANTSEGKRSEYTSGDKVKRGNDRDDGMSQQKSSSKPAARKYKLLKDV